MAASTLATAAKYNPLTGLAAANTSGNGGASGFFKLNPTSFSNPNAPTSPATTANGTAGFASSINGAGAYTPDWAALINNDAGLKSVQAAMNASNAQNQDALNAEIANAYETFGSNVDLGDLAAKLGMSQADLQNVITPAIRQLAQENTNAGLSTQARLDQQNKQSTQQLLADLNRRGLLHSGEAGYQLDQLNTGYRQAQSDAYQKLLGYLQQYQQGYLTALNKNTGKVTDAISAAATRQAGLNQGSAGVSATLDHVDALGHAVYRDAAGNLFNADGTPYSAPAAPPPPPPPAAPAPPVAPTPSVGYQQAPRNARTFGAA